MEKMLSVEKIYNRCFSGPYRGELTAQNISLYHTSPYTIFCHKFVSEDKQDAMSPYRELILKRGQDHERRVIERFYPESAVLHYKKPEEGFHKLLEDMAKGARVLCGLPVFFLPENMQGRIDVLEKQKNHASVFGEYHYVVKEIKLSKNIKFEHVMQGAFYTYLIGKLQEYFPEKFFIINRDYDQKAYNFQDYAADLAEAIRGTQAILNKTENPTPTYNGSEWPWQTYSNHQALKNRDVSIVGHVGPQKKNILVKYGYKKIWDLSSAKMDDLQEIPGIARTTAQKIILSAQAIKDRKLMPLDRTVLEFPRKSTGIFLDLEGTDQPGVEEEMGQVDYLIGILVRRDGEDTYRPFLAHRIEDEGKMFAEFLSFMRTQEDYVIYHWHNYEHWHIKQLAERHDALEEVKALLFPNMIDLHKVATSAFVFPTYSNGLKDIAAYIGFKWRHEDINALDAIAYYLKYQEDPEGLKARMQAIVDYNEDDCRATMWVYDWLTKSAS